MLYYGIGALLIVLIITITLSYYKNIEGFQTFDANVLAAAPAVSAALAPALAPTLGPAVAPTVASAIKSAIKSEIKPTIDSVNNIKTTSVSSDLVDPTSDLSLAIPAPGQRELAKSKHNIGTVSNKLPSQSIKPNNIDSILRKDKLVVKTDYKGDFLRIFASMSSLTDNEAQQFWIIGKNPEEPVIWDVVIVTNDPGYESASIPKENYAPYIGQIVYVVPKGSFNRGDAYASFIVPTPSNNPRPTIVNPKVEISDTGYEAMKLNKQSNLLNDIQKIIHNEMLSHRTLDVSVKNSSSKPASNVKDTSTPLLPGSCNSSCINNSCANTSCGRSENDPDMSKYIRKDQIPCYGCSLDY